MSINREFEQVPAEHVKQASEFQASTAEWARCTDVLGPLVPNIKMAGSTFTVELRPCLMIHAAVALAKPRDVSVVDGKGDQTAALMGVLMMKVQGTSASRGRATVLSATMRSRWSWAFPYSPLKSSAASNGGRRAPGLHVKGGHRAIAPHFSIRKSCDFPPDACFSGIC